MTNIADFASGRSGVLESDNYMGSGIRARLETAPPRLRRAYRGGDDGATYFDAFERTASPSRRRRRRRALMEWPFLRSLGGSSIPQCVARRPA